MGTSILTNEVSTFGDQIQASLHLMDGHIKHFHTHPLFVKMARQICAAAGAKTRMEESKAIWKWCKEKIRYRHDPAGAEWIQDPVATLTQGEGDCDDKAVLAGTLLAAIGHPCIPMAVWWNRPDRHYWSHAVVFDAMVGEVVDPVGTDPENWPPPGWPVKRMSGPKPSWPVRTVPSFAANQAATGALQGWSIRKLKHWVSKEAGKISKILPKPLRRIDEKLRGAVERFDTSVSKDFAKAKHWSQDHRKTLQIIAATALTLGVATYYVGWEGVWGAVKAKMLAMGSATAGAFGKIAGAAIAAKLLDKQRAGEPLSPQEQQVLSEAQLAQLGQAAGILQGGIPADAGGVGGPAQGGGGGAPGEPFNMTPWLIGGGALLLVAAMSGGNSKGGAA